MMTEQDEHPPEQAKDIWPHWSEGVPTKLSGNPRSLELSWSSAYTLSLLKKKKNLLPGTHWSEWSGVSRIFLLNTTIDRFCGKDPTGTLYLGRVGSGAKSWSILRNRIMAIVKGDHHAKDFRDVFKQKYSHEALAVEWAYAKDNQGHYDNRGPRVVSQFDFGERLF
jgi:hypothetical protein